MRIDPQSLTERLRSLARLNTREQIQEELSASRVEDIAEGLVRLSTDEAIALLEQLEPAQAAEVLVELPMETARQIMAELDDSTLAYYLDVLPMDDAMDLRDVLGDERFEGLLEVIPRRDAQELRRLMAYPEDSVGRLMTEAFFEVGPEQTMADVIADVRRSPVDKYEMVNDIYVLTSDRHLVGVFSLRKAIRARPDVTAQEVMNTDIVSVNGYDDAEDAARRMTRYGFYALPVLNDRGQMVGLFTGDDAQAILQEAETEDVLKMGAVSGDAEAYLSLGVLRLAWKRIPWLLALFLAEQATGSVMRMYGENNAALKLSPITYFIPLLIGAGGNSGSQVTTMVTRALALGEITPFDWYRVIRREFLTALLVGGLFGLLGYIRAAFFWNSGPKLSLVVALALPAIIIWATTVGSLLPLGAKRLRIDPAVMSAPFISTFVDATGLIIYFEIARRIMGGLSL